MSLRSHFRFMDEGVMVIGIPTVISRGLIRGGFADLNDFRFEDKSTTNRIEDLAAGSSSKQHISTIMPKLKFDNITVNISKSSPLTSQNEFRINLGPFILLLIPSTLIFLVCIIYNNNKRQYKRIIAYIICIYLFSHTSSTIKQTKNIKHTFLFRDTQAAYSNHDLIQTFRHT